LGSTQYHVPAGKDEEKEGNRQQDDAHVTDKYNVCACGTEFFLGIIGH
jgi:hypothetical protein